MSDVIKVMKAFFRFHRLFCWEIIFHYDEFFILVPQKQELAATWFSMCWKNCIIVCRQNSQKAAFVYHLKAVFCNVCKIAIVVK